MADSSARSEATQPSPSVGRPTPEQDYEREVRDWETVTGTAEPVSPPVRTAPNEYDPSTAPGGAAAVAGADARPLQGRQHAPGRDYMARYRREDGSIDYHRWAVEHDEL